MKFSLTAFIVTVAAVVVSGVISFMEGNFTSKNVTMGFVNHGGMWGDLIIMSVVTGLVFPYLIKNQICMFSALFLALTVAIIAHIFWAKGMQSEAVTGHMFPSHKTGKWYLDICGAGWMHVLVTTMLLAVIFIYAISPLPKNVIIATSLLLTIHVVIASVQPGWYCTGELWTLKNFVPPLVVAALIWSIAVLKIQLARGNS
jgi:hypothetical protein